jgi:hypothetical protein
MHETLLMHIRACSSTATTAAAYHDVLLHFKAINSGAAASGMLQLAATKLHKQTVNKHKQL